MREVVHDSRGRLYTPGKLTRDPQEAKIPYGGCPFTNTRQSLDVAGSERPSIFVFKTQLKTGIQFMPIHAHESQCSKEAPSDLPYYQAQMARNFL